MMFKVLEGELVKWIDDNKTEFAKKAKKYLYPGMRENKTEDIFERHGYIFPSQLNVKNLGKPFDAFNPGAKLKGKKLSVYPRLVFDHVRYISSIGYFELDIEEVLNKRVRDIIECDLLLYATEYWERRKGCEDPRIFSKNGKDYILYTAIGDWTYKNKKVEIDALACAQFRDNKCLRKDYFLLSSGDGETFLTFSNKDAYILDLYKEDASILLRPEFIVGGVDALENKVRICWRGRADLDRMVIYDMEPIMGTEKFEEKVGISTNAIQIGADEFLISWHGKSRLDFYYRNGFGIVDKDGNLLGITKKYLLEPDKNNPLEMLGSYIGVIFPCGMIEYRDRIILFAGVGDKRIGIFSAEKDKILERIEWLEE